jgi:excinuclease UvrABC ATPase subunit
METVSSPCEVCGGRRFQAFVLEYTLGGKSIADVFDMPISEAETFFAPKGSAPLAAAHKILDRLVQVGIGYISLGQALSTLSGGERQRLKLASRLAASTGRKDEPSVIVLDEPTTGLHLADIQKLLILLDTMVDEGRTVVVIEHNQAVMAHADWIIDMGPGAGNAGGRVVYEGTPADLVSSRATLTGEHLARYVGGSASVG